MRYASSIARKRTLHACLMGALKSQLLVVYETPKHDWIAAVSFYCVTWRLGHSRSLTRKYWMEDVLFISIKRHSGVLDELSEGTTARPVKYTASNSIVRRQPVSTCAHARVCRLWQEDLSLFNGAVYISLIAQYQKLTAATASPQSTGSAVALSADPSSACLFSLCIPNSPNQ